MDSSYAGGVTVDGTHVTDDVTTGTANSYFSQSTHQLNASITAVNDAPTAGNALYTQSEDAVTPAGQTVSALFAAGFSDVDTGDTLAGILITADAAVAAEGLSLIHI